MAIGGQPLLQGAAAFRLARHRLVLGVLWRGLPPSSCLLPLLGCLQLTSFASSGNQIREQLCKLIPPPGAMDLSGLAAVRCAI